jgi:hypothetical protein
MIFLGFLQAQNFAQNFAQDFTRNFAQNSAQNLAQSGLSQIVRLLSVFYVIQFYDYFFL